MVLPSTPMGLRTEGGHPLSGSWFHQKSRHFQCAVCRRLVTDAGPGLGVCPECLRSRWDEAEPVVETIHRRSRERFDLPPRVPRAPVGVECALCLHRCRMEPRQKGYCGIRQGSEESLRRDGRHRALLSYYHDPIPTNCVADWVCAAGTGSGYPAYSRERGPEVGCYNLAVFFEACNFNCLYCQNWSFKKSAKPGGTWTVVEDLLPAVTDQTSCICYFGGDPVPQLPFAIRFSRRALEKRSGSVLRICWETNGSLHPAWIKPMADLSLRSGGCIKVDLKAWDPHVHKALCGCGNRRVLENFARIAGFVPLRRDPPLLVASTLLVPGYVGEEEIFHLARFIASLDPHIPYALLGFAPQFYLNDFPTTSRSQAEACLEAAQKAGLKRVRLANRHLLH